MSISPSADDPGDQEVTPVAVAFRRQPLSLMQTIRSPGGSVKDSYRGGRVREVFVPLRPGLDDGLKLPERLVGAPAEKAPTPAVNDLITMKKTGLGPSRGGIVVDFRIEPSFQAFLPERVCAVCWGWFRSWRRG